ncbi:MAG TPA: RusA family crossover junction endodeoxyribonuclease [Longimicrobium sp.]|nr:RusA family crossover junction endodeoxyribonuclease [Longimicrobium sp.]
MCRAGAWPPATRSSRARSRRRRKTAVRPFQRETPAPPSRGGRSVQVALVLGVCVRTLAKNERGRKKLANESVSLHYGRPTQTPGPMYAFVAGTRPRSVQARKTEYYKSELARAFQHYVPNGERLEGELYGVVYYFHNVPTDTDADNISKPVWDTLEGLAFANDRNVRLRIAGMHDLSVAPLGTLDVSRVPAHLLTDLEHLAQTSDHILYVEVGPLHHSMYRFGHELSDDGNPR